MINNATSQLSQLEIDHALKEYSTLFASEKNKQHLEELRKIAIEAMGFLKDYSPYLTGRVMEGTAGLHTPITLHLFAETAEEIMFFMGDNNIPFQTHEQHFIVKNKKEKIPLLVFYVDDIEVELLLFQDENRHIAPISNITGKKMKRIAIKAVKKLVPCA
jgi:3'-phosphoadenosine 5'-phosphosulfate sulfotransferase (PAPS reductase)/FAD synthetase